MGIFTEFAKRLNWTHFLLILFIIYLISLTFYKDMDDSLPRNLNKFPKDFIWGTATAAYQIEGASEEGGRSLSVWDAIRRIPGRIKDNSDPNLSCDGYKHWREDVQLLKHLGVTHYRFTISWSRVLPTGKIDKINEEGINFYRNLCVELIANGIQPIATLFHYDFPLKIHEEGGFLNPDSIQWFTDFAELCFERFGDLVKIWVTFNEVIPNAMFGVVPMENLPKFALDPVVPLERWNLTKRQAPYRAAHHQILAHARVYRLYKAKFFSKQKGQIGLVSGGRSAETLRKDPESLAAAQRALAWQFFWVNQPIFGNGDYPEVMKKRLATLAEEESLSEILPQFTEEEKQEVRGSADFLGINYYLVMTVGSPSPDSVGRNSFVERDAQYDYYPDTYERISGQDSWLRNTPHGLSDVFEIIKKNFGNIPIMISENGCADYLPPLLLTDPLEDYHRIRYIREHVETIGEAIAKGYNVIGYSVWTLMDNFEWEDGFAVRFGLYRVDFESPDKERTPKKSVSFFKRLIETARKTEQTEKEL